MNAPVPYNPVPSATVAARDAALSLLEESTAHRIDPIMSCEPIDDRVYLTVQPERMNVWQTWLGLLRAGSTTFDQDSAHATGRWLGVQVEVTAVRPHKWWDR